MSMITLTNDPEQIAQINSEKVLVAVPLLYTFMVQFIHNVTDSLLVPGITIDQERARKIREIK